MVQDITAPETDKSEAGGAPLTEVAPPAPAANGALTAIWGSASGRARLLLTLAVATVVLAALAIPSLVGSWRLYRIEPAGIRLQLPKAPTALPVADSAKSVAVFECLTPELAVVLAGWPAIPGVPAGELARSGAQMAMLYLENRQDISGLRYQLTDITLKNGVPAVQVSGTMKLNEVPARVVGLAGNARGRQWHVLVLFTVGHEAGVKQAARVLNSIRPR